MSMPFCSLLGLVLQSQSMSLSGHTMKDEIAKSRIFIEPLDSTCIQPAAVDVHVEKIYRLAGLGSEYEGRGRPIGTRYYPEFSKER